MNGSVPDFAEVVAVGVLAEDSGEVSLDGVDFVGSSFSFDGDVPVVGVGVVAGVVAGGVVVVAGGGVVAVVVVVGGGGGVV